MIVLTYLDGKKGSRESQDVVFIRDPPLVKAEVQVQAEALPLSDLLAAAAVDELVPRVLRKHRLSVPADKDHHHLINYKGEIKRSTCQIRSCGD